MDIYKSYLTVKQCTENALMWLVYKDRKRKKNFRRKGYGKICYKRKGRLHDRFRFAT